jgi:hypothetical protein
MKITVFFSLLIVALISGCSGKSTSGNESVQEEWKTKNNRLEAYVMMQEYVKKDLKSPSTAKFGRTVDNGVIITPEIDQKYLISSYVDSQNDFGATVRTYFGGEIQQISEDEWLKISLEYGEKPIIPKSSVEMNDQIKIRYGFDIESNAMIIQNSMEFPLNNCIISLDIWNNLQTAYTLICNLEQMGITDQNDPELFYYLEDWVKLENSRTLQNQKLYPLNEGDYIKSISLDCDEGSLFEEVKNN